MKKPLRRSTCSSIKSVSTSIPCPVYLEWGTWCGNWTSPVWTGTREDGSSFSWSWFLRHVFEMEKAAKGCWRLTNESPISKLAKIGLFLSGRSQNCPLKNVELSLAVSLVYFVKLEMRKVKKILKKYFALIYSFIYLNNYWFLNDDVCF